MKLFLVLLSIFLFSSVSYQLEGKPDHGKDDNSTPAPPPSAPPAPPAEPPSLLQLIDLLKNYVIASSKTTPEPPTTTTPEPTTTIPEFQPIFPENFTWIDLPDESKNINLRNNCLVHIDTFSVRGKCIAHHVPLWAPHTCWEMWGLISYNNTYFIRFDDRIVSYEAILKAVHHQQHVDPDLLHLYLSYLKEGSWGEVFACDTSEGRNIAVLNGEEVPFTPPLSEYEPLTLHSDLFIQDHEMVDGLCHAVGKIGETEICEKYQIDRFALYGGYWYVNRATPLVDSYGFIRLSTVVLEEADAEALKVIVEELGYIVNGRPEAEHNRNYPIKGTITINPAENGMKILGQGKHREEEFVFSGWFTWKGFLVVCVLIILLIILFFLFVILYCEWRKASSKTQSTIRTQTTTTTTTVTKDGYRRLPNYDLDDDDDALLDSAASGTGKGNSTPPPASAPASASTPSVSMV